MRRFLSISLLCAVSCIGNAGCRRRADFRVVRDVSYLEPGRAEKLDVYIPANRPPNSRMPALIWIHGNGHDKADKRERGICETLASAGYVCVAINYGPWNSALLGDPNSDRHNLQDAKNAVRFLRSHASEYSVEPTQIAVGGGSAGGYLALMVGFTAGEATVEPARPYPNISSKVSAVVDFYGLFDWLADPRIKARISKAPAFEELRAVDPATYISPQSPPVFIAHGRNDPLISFEHSVALDRSLTEKAVPHELVLMEGVGHSFDLVTWQGTPLPRDLRPLVIAFLSKYLGPPVKAN